ncbi:hypothetical protein V5799_017214, partial [Amblyomma americanum]
MVRILVPGAPSITIFPGAPAVTTFTTGVTGFMLGGPAGPTTPGGFSFAFP